MARQQFLRPLFFALKVSFIVLWWPREVSAHAPHDEVSALVLSPHYFYDGIAFAIVRYNILRSTDFGYTWRRLTRGLRRCTFRDLAISPSFAADRCVFASSPEAGIFQSRDAGLSWVSLSDTLPDCQIDFLAISPLFQSDRRLLAAGRDGQLYLTTDAGDHWRQCFGDGQRVSAAAVVRCSIVVGTSAGSIHRSDDGGGQWRVLARLQAHQPITCFAAVDDAASTLLVGTGNGCVALTDAETGSETRSAGLAGRHITSLLSTQHADGHPILFASTWRAALFHSHDVGRSWRQYGAGLTTDRQADWPQFRRPHFKSIAASATFPADQTLFLAGFDGVFKSIDGGTSWREMRGALSIGLIVGLDVAQADDTTLRVAASTYVAGVYSRSGEGPWDVGNVGLDGGRLSDIAFSPDYAVDRTVFALGNWALFKSVDGGLSWEPTRLVCAPRTVHQLKTQVLSWLRGIVPMLMRAWGRERVHRWKQSFAWLLLRDEHIIAPGWGAVLAVCPDFGTSRMLFIGGPAGVLRSLDGGRSFDSVLERAGAPVRALVASPDFARDGTVFAAFDEQLFRSVDRGSTWEPLFDGQGMASPRLGVSPAYRRDQTVFVGGESGLWRSGDGGRSWRRLQPVTSAPNAAIDGLAISPCFDVRQELLAHVVGLGLFHSRDGGETFVRIAFDDVGPGLAASHMTGFPDRASLIKFSPRYGTDRTVFVSSMEDLLKTSDLGRTWEVLDRPVRFEGVRPEIVYQGDWHIVRDKKFSSGAATCASEAGAIAAMEFVGRGVCWIGRRGPTHGAARVLIDDVVLATVDQYAPTLSFGVVSFAATELPRGPHIITIEVITNRNRRSRGSEIIVDALDVV
jgi:photosystem II stability/assembly factor-like uncharacterized protein